MSQNETQAMQVACFPTRDVEDALQADVQLSDTRLACMRAHVFKQGVAVCAKVLLKDTPSGGKNGRTDLMLITLLRRLARFT